MVPIASAMEECITESEAKQKYMMKSPHSGPNASAMAEFITAKQK